jgi:multiple antibiotic resistance protein
MTAITTAFLAVFVGLFPIVNPLGGAPIFLRLTSGVSQEVRAKLAGRIAVGGFALMVGALFVGSYILAFFGLTMPAVQVAGGLVVIAAAWRLLHEGESRESRERQSKVREDAVLHRAFYPITMPLTVGPGSISVAITLGAKSAVASHSLAEVVGGLLGALAVALSIYVCYRFASQIIGRLGEAGRDVFLRLSAFLLLCLGVQILWNGIEAMIPLARG